LNTDQKASTDKSSTKRFNFDQKRLIRQLHSELLIDSKDIRKYIRRKDKKPNRNTEQAVSEHLDSISKSQGGPQTERPTFKSSIDDLKVNISMQIISILKKISILNSSDKLSACLSQELNAFDYDAFISRTIDPEDSENENLVGLNFTKNRRASD
jgi:hypothetical protein